MKPKESLSAQQFLEAIQASSLAPSQITVQLAWWLQVTTNLTQLNNNETITYSISCPFLGPCNLPDVKSKHCVQLHGIRRSQRMLVHSAPDSERAWLQVNISALTAGNPQNLLLLGTYDNRRFGSATTANAVRSSTDNVLAKSDK